MNEKNMHLQIGIKTLNEIKELINTNCWKAVIWIHAIIFDQLYKLINYSAQVKVEDNKLKFVRWDNLKNRQQKIFDSIRTFGALYNICYARGLIDEEYDDIMTFNSFRNNKLIHIKLNKYLPPDDKIKVHCELGLKIIKNLDKKLLVHIHEKIE